ncbi:MAG: CBS domain-containing protein [Anaerolineales bacterium]|nr:CBS domain-containing protein [Anaerolineales bacterium]
MQRTIRQILARKSGQIWAVSPEATVYEALEVLAAKNIGAVLVLDQGRLCGILSERDYTRKVVLAGRSSRTTQVSEIMTERVLVISPDDSIDKCMALMTDKRVRHLPVMEKERLVGVISIGDVVRALIEDQEFMIEQLETYITGRPALA